MITRKSYRLPDDIINYIKQIQNQNGYETETKALIKIIKEHKEMENNIINENEKQELADIVVKTIQTKFKNDFDRVRLASTFAERYTYMILDAINTILYETRIDLMISAQGETRHKVLEQSMEQFKSAIAKNKQVKDNDNLKRG